jgi:hypothetical protein
MNGMDDMIYDQEISRSRWPLPFRQQSLASVVGLFVVIALVGVVCANLPGAWTGDHGAASVALNHATSQTTN